MVHRGDLESLRWWFFTHTLTCTREKDTQGGNEMGGVWGEVMRNCQQGEARGWCGVRPRDSSTNREFGHLPQGLTQVTAWHHDRKRDMGEIICLPLVQTCDAAKKGGVTVHWSKSYNVWLQGFFFMLSQKPIEKDLRNKSIFGSAYVAFLRLRDRNHRLLFLGTGEVDIESDECRPSKPNWYGQKINSNRLAGFQYIKTKQTAR